VVCIGEKPIASSIAYWRRLSAYTSCNRLAAKDPARAAVAAPIIVTSLILFRSRSADWKLLRSGSLKQNECRRCLSHSWSSPRSWSSRSTPASATGTLLMELARTTSWFRAGTSAGPPPRRAGSSVTDERNFRNGSWLTTVGNEVTPMPAASARTVRTFWPFALRRQNGSNLP